MHDHIMTIEFTTLVCIICGESEGVIAARLHAAHEAKINKLIMQTDSFDDFEEDQGAYARPGEDTGL